MHFTFCVKGDAIVFAFDPKPGVFATDNLPRPADNTNNVLLPGLEQRVPKHKRNKRVCVTIGASWNGTIGPWELCSPKITFESSKRIFGTLYRMMAVIRR